MGKKDVFAIKYEGIARTISAGKEVQSDHSQKQGLLVAVIARSFELELKRIRAGKTIRFGGSCLVAAKKFPVASVF